MWAPELGSVLTNLPPMVAKSLLVLLALPLASCAGGVTGAGVASFGVETLARGIIGKIDNDGGLFGQDTSTVLRTPEQQAQRNADAYTKSLNPYGGNDKGTVIVQGQQGQGYRGGMQSAGYGYGQQPYYPPPPPYGWRPY